jgi:hypothetical protein
MVVDARNPPIELITTIAPSPFARISGRASWISQWFEMTLLSRILRNCSSAMPSMDP